MPWSALGVHYTLSSDRTRCEVTGNGGPLQAAEALELFLGNAGTAMRPLAAALCLGRNDIVADRRAANERAADWPPG
ncbi:3-phosphoshikimate 1-carboxyvinyltransferase [Klebsiella michiganensis]|uniref:3-phosphoshikimate 1-carboxyvinyltransferase n=1 Tax=Klebsiella michiganensis TaxID=1134687 RepID=A0A7H4N2M2_9ENTR|nr:3-phosphoshikimate 1-carboxyvinyltransferase [Klebsiella michiganensis]